MHDLIEGGEESRPVVIDVVSNQKAIVNLDNFSPDDAKLLFENMENEDPLYSYVTFDQQQELLRRGKLFEKSQDPDVLIRQICNVHRECTKYSLYPIVDNSNYIITKFEYPTRCKMQLKTKFRGVVISSDISVKISGIILNDVVFKFGKNPLRILDKIWDILVSEVLGGYYIANRNNEVFEDTPNKFMGPAPEENKYKEISTKITNKLQIPFESNDFIIFIESLYLDDIFALGNICGSDTPEVSNAINRAETKIFVNKKRDARSAELFKRISHEHILKSIIIKEFGYNRFLKISNKINSLMDGLTANEKKLVEKRLVEKRTVCIHTKMLYNLNNSILSQNTQEYLDKVLRNIKDPKKTSGLHTCKVCDRGFVCPHTIKCYEYMLRHRTQNLSKVLPQYIVTDDRGYNICKICSELIEVSDGDEITTGSEYQRVDETFDELSANIWRISFLVLEYFDMTANINTKMLFRYIHNNLYLFITTTEKKLYRNKLYTDQDIANKMEIIIAIYIFAFLINILIYGSSKLNNKKTKTSLYIKFKKAPDYKFAADPNVNLSSAILYATDIIKKRFVLNPSIASIDVKTEIVSSIKQIAAKYGEVKMELTDTEHNLMYNILLDPMYKYIATIKSIVNHKVIGDYYDSIEKICNISPKEMSSTPRKVENLYRNVSLVPKNLISDNKIIKLFNDTLEANNNLLYMEAPYVDGYLSSRYLEYYTKLNKYISDNHFEYTEKDLRKNTGGWSKLCAEDKPVTMAFRKIPVNIAEYYGEDGHEHKFNIFIIHDIPHTLDNIQKNLTLGTPLDIKKISDVECGVCKLRRSKTAEIPEATIRASLEEITKRNNFFDYYQYRCPKSFIHIFTNGTCICGATSAILASRDIKYYEKYSSGYEKITETAAANISMRDAPEPALIDIDEDEVIDNINLNKFCKKFSVNQTLILNIPYMENATISDVKTKDLSFEKPLDYGAEIMYGYTQDILISYNRIRNAKYIKLSAEIKGILEKHDYDSVLNNRYPESSKLLDISPPRSTKTAINQFVNASLLLSEVAEPVDEVLKIVIKGIIHKATLRCAPQNIDWKKIMVQVKGNVDEIDAPITDTLNNIAFDDSVETTESLIKEQLESGVKMTTTDELFSNAETDD